MVRHAAPWPTIVGLYVRGITIVEHMSICLIYVELIGQLQQQHEFHIDQNLTQQNTWKFQQEQYLPQIEYKLVIACEFGQCG